MRTIMTEGAQDWVSILLTALGISLAPHEFFGGLFMALALSSMLARHRKDPRKIWAALSTAGLFAIIAAVAWEWGGWDFAPIQLVMGVAGFLGRPGIVILVKLQERLEKRSAEIADRAIDRILPGEGD